MAERPPPKKTGRPPATVKLVPLTFNADPDLLALIERALERRRRNLPHLFPNKSSVIRELLIAAGAAEEAADAQPQLPLESTTRKP